MRAGLRFGRCGGCGHAAFSRAGAVCGLCGGEVVGEMAPADVHTGWRCLCGGCTGTPC